MENRGRLLIYAPVPVYRDHGRLFLEAQSIVGLNRWADHFSHVDVMMPVRDDAPPQGWVKPGGKNALPDNILLHVLPTAYRPDQFLRHYRATRRMIAELIDRNDYLSFAIGGLFGDWGAVAGFEARRKGRPFAVWADRVESEVIWRGRHDGNWRHRLRARLYSKPMEMLEHAVIRRADLGLFHGRETFDAYASFSDHPEVVHDILLEKSDHIPTRMLRQKIFSAGVGPLRIVFAGRADPMKGPLDWVAVLDRLNQMGVDFRAKWLGDGELFEAMKAEIGAKGLSDRVETPGFLTDRQAVLDELRAAHVHLFCHNTPESPRNLIEALFSGTPIIGYDGAYARDLVHGHKGGDFVPIGDIDGLADLVARLAGDREELAEKIEDAYNDGKIFSADAVFKHRSDLIKEYLPGPVEKAVPLHA